jgi:hypothetical protein
MKCPVCGLLNPEGSSWCDCGYGFKIGAGGVGVPFRKRYRGLLFVAGMIVLWIFMAFLTTWLHSSGWHD